MSSSAKPQRDLSVDEVLALIDKHTAWLCSEYPRVDDAIYQLQEAVKEAAITPKKASKP